MPVRFAERAEVFMFENVEGDAEWRRPFANYNLEYKREARLFDLVLEWKRTQKRVAPHSKMKNRAIKTLVGKQYAKKVLAVFGAKTVGELENAILESVLAQWPLLEMRATQGDYKLSSEIVLSVVAETLFDKLDFCLEGDENKAKFFSLVFHVSQGILNVRYP
ncbi:Hypothetical Protein FCC1311_069492 [Hondaea fermentalgiana]|uniref:Uncharacterized protein n=1 Tax=Hondaea fermentalgiana TaxID=2315210 RepID=A0A2R5GK82_9STRA|nr:Hypothetical Protein FCC1311_069492 [Hondaea fermentalgiana]|eukprot:GBG30729.1 Hypothetical Protein FCC1311_069492 [Hondaea fermentalgiana]